MRRAFGDRVVLDGIDLTIAPGQFVALFGQSGTGKSTCCGPWPVWTTDIEGHIAVPRQRAVVFQEPRLMPWKRVWRNVILGLDHGRDNDRARADARAVLAEVGLTSHEEAWPSTLSGGEAQRVALARALARQPELLLLDEPFGALDALTRLRMQELVAQLCARHDPSVLLVTHDVDEAIRLAHRILVLHDGRLVTDLEVHLPSPRRPSDPFGTLRAQLLGDLGVHAAA